MNTEAVCTPLQCNKDCPIPFSNECIKSIMDLVTGTVRRRLDLPADHPDVQDLVNETLASVWQAVDNKVEIRETLRQYASGTARNTVNNHLRREHRRAQIVSFIPLETVTDAGAVTYLPRAEAVTITLIAAIEAALSGTDAEIAKMLALGYTVREAATALGLSYSAVYKRITRKIRPQLKDVLRRSIDESNDRADNDQEEDD